MAKPKSPLFSLVAKGTIADQLTFQKRGHATMIREKPTPKDPYSLNQAYQRWDYRDYAYLWTLLSNSEKQVYRTKASRYHITGFSQWMRENLKDLPNLVGRWHFDEKSGSTAYDSSKQGNNGTIFGASPTNGVIGGAYHFDGINDYISLGNSPILNLVAPFTIECFINQEAAVQKVIVMTSTSFALSSYHLLINSDLTPRLGYNSGTTVYYITSLIPITLGQNHHLVAIFVNPTTAYLFLDGVDITNTILSYTPYVRQFVLLNVGATTTPTLHWNGNIDHLCLYDRSLDITEIKRHSERRYPS